MARYAESVSNVYEDALAEQEDEQERLESNAEITAAKDGQERKLDDLKSRKAELDGKVTKLKKEKSDAAMKAAAAAESASSARGRDGEGVRFR